MMLKKKAYVEQKRCVACGACYKSCPKNAITIWKGIYAIINAENCVGCGLCEKTCPAGAISRIEIKE